MSSLDTCEGFSDVAQSLPVLLEQSVVVGNTSNEISSSLVLGENETIEKAGSKSFRWMGPLLGHGAPRASNSANSKLHSDNVEAVRKRIEKRKRRNGVNILPELSSESATKRSTNTLAARRYRQKRQEEVDVLDNRVKELEKELAMAKLETKWWQMEAQRWQKLAEHREK
ncbi:hypothetical protein V1525DRAFT_409569 [Lipomyces kononenkoae]|uniref:Uncharacterized protein n=1 Tax=Lipomyces kononenkoae TaxID=34357 RepID=A0ACC3SWU2_LIPKO